MGVYVFIVVNVLMCLSDLIDMDACATRSCTLSLSLLLAKHAQNSPLTHTHIHSVQSVKAAPNVWASRHSTGLPPSLPAASS